MTIFEAEAQFGTGATAAAIGGISPLSDDFIRAQLAPMCGDIFDAFWRLVQRCAEAGQAFPIVEEGLMYVALTPDDEARLTGPYRESLGDRFAVRWLPKGEALALEPTLTPALMGALLIPEEPALDPSSLLRSVLHLLSESGKVSVRLGTRVSELVDNMMTAVGRDGEVTVEEFDRIVIATGNDAALLPSPLRTSMVPVKGQALRLADPGSSHPLFAHHVYAHLPASGSDLNTSAYLVPRTDGSVVAGVTYEEQFPHDFVTVEGLHEITGGIRRLVPSARHWAMTAAWAGRRPATVDGGPIVGVLPGAEAVIYAMGHFGLGVTLAPLTAELVAEILGLSDRGLMAGGGYDPLSPERFH
ncbi:glycine oxidase ThiO [Actinoplanes friuliensis DSM 7358]|uniref:Glycine oxidase ThiO n=1 Tax=Actinoplanes friuliensis DSM 7358 TaxID=1246995 RepID=U5VWC0_9ACTN|nr:glycine oxidase ThiO [Actinoplanes friuliensis DSM 7358]